jgi:serine/threonine protein kinase
VSNVLLDREGHAKLADFGLAKQAALTDSFVGSVSYLPPEMLVPGEKKPHTKALDWYLLGIFIYELIHGEPPFHE